MLKKFGLKESKPTKMPMLTEIKLTKDDEANFVDITKYQVYAYSGHASNYVDRKSIIGVCMFMECCLTSWFSKK
uniref:Retrotransposon protein, putative, unclassified n=1 Tax=Tanacetum cinerariifolium TaxID=118510 RepID=A0A699T0R3_TANCI|nr:retrotransposon protein, putative, unclassified [Tanacetum cinerariifolium]